MDSSYDHQPNSSQSDSTQDIIYTCCHSEGCKGEKVWGRLQNLKHCDICHQQVTYGCEKCGYRATYNWFKRHHDMYKCAIVDRKIVHVRSKVFDVHMRKKRAPSILRNRQAQSNSTNPQAEVPSPSPFTQAEVPSPLPFTSPSPSPLIPSGVPPCNPVLYPSGTVNIPYSPGDTSTYYTMQAATVMDPFNTNVTYMNYSPGQTNDVFIYPHRPISLPSNSDNILEELFQITSQGIYFLKTVTKTLDSNTFPASQLHSAQLTHIHHIHVHHVHQQCTDSNDITTTSKLQNYNVFFKYLFFRTNNSCYNNYH
jgi:hypothetical protein